MTQRIAPTLCVGVALLPFGSGLLPPWKESVGGRHVDMIYMPFFERQLQVLEDLEAQPLPLAPDLALASSDVKTARMGSQLFQVPGLFRRIRMTYFDGGENIQVFNSLWYPSFERVDAPLLGVDLLSFGSQRNLLCVVDAQPPGGRRPELPLGVAHDAHRFQAVKDAAPDLAGTVSERWYEDSRYFSPQMLYSRFENTGLEGLRTTLFPAFATYLEAYVDVVESASTDADAADNERRQAAYDQWNADRDPAHRLFKSYFGSHFADNFVHNFLFAMSTSSDNAS